MRISSVLNIGGSACVYLRHTDFWHDGAPGSAAPAPDQIDTAYRAIMPDTRLVILAARNTMYVDTAAEAAEKFDFSGIGHFASPEFPAAGPVEAFERSLRSRPCAVTRIGSRSDAGVAGARTRLSAGALFACAPVRAPAADTRGQLQRAQGQGRAGNRRNIVRRSPRAVHAVNDPAPACRRPYGCVV